MALGGGDDAVDGVLELRVIELPGDSEGIGEVEVADPQHVDAVHRRDGVHVGDSLRGLDLGDDQLLLVGALHLLDDIAARVVVVRDAESSAAAAGGWVLHRLGDESRLLRALHHRHHQAHGSQVENSREKVVFRRRHAHHRHQVRRA